MKLAWPAAAGIWLLFVTACVPTFPQIVPNQNSPIRTVAIVPLVNNSNDVDGPAYVRDIFLAELGQFFYVIKPANEVDQVLKDQMGVTLGSQLDMTTPQKLGEVLGVDGVFYGSLASSRSDKEDTALPKLFSEDVAAAWQELPEQAGTIEANVVQAWVERF